MATSPLNVSGTIGLPIPAPVNPPGSGPASSPTPTTAVFPFSPRNAHYVALEAQYNLDRDEGALLRAAIGQLATRPDTVSPKLDLLVERLADTNKSLARIGNDGPDYVSALFSAAFDISGVVVANNNVGDWIIAAWPSTKARSTQQPTVCDIAKLNDTGKSSALENFLKELAASKASYPGLAQVVEEGDLRRFIARCRGVCEALASIGPAPSPPPASPTIGTP
jgi:hypothetical protein